MNDAIDRALSAALDDEEERERPDRKVMVRSLTESNIDNIEKVIGQLRTNLAAIEQQIIERQDRHRQTKRSIAAFELALRMLQS